MEAIAKLNRCPVSPRKMRLVADQVRGKDIQTAFNILKFNQKQVYANYINGLLKSAVTNWEQKNDQSMEGAELFIKTIFVDSGSSLKRLRTAPQGRAHRIRKRSNHITIVVDSLLDNKSETNENKDQ